METLKEELLRKKIIMTWEEWWAIVGEAYRYLSNKYDPKDLYEEYVNEIVADYEKIEREKKNNG